MLIGIAFSASDYGHKNLRWPGKRTLEKQFHVPVTVSISMYCWSELFVPGQCGCLQEHGSEAPQGRSVACTSVLRSPGMQGAHSSLHFAFPVFQRGATASASCTGCAVELQGMLSAVVHTGNEELSFPSCVGASVEFSFNVHPNLSNASSYTDTSICLPGCQQSTGCNLESGLRSKYSVDLS